MSTTTTDRELTRALLAAMREGVVVHDESGEVVEVNPRFCEISGYSRAELIGRTPPLPLWGDGPVRDLAGAGRAVLLHRDGRRLPVEVRTMPIASGAGGRVVLVSEATRDVGRSERERFEQRSSDSEALSHAVLSSHPAQIAVLDGDGKIIAVNEAWRTFARENGGSDATGCVGTNYLEVCSEASGANADGAPQAVQGIRAVLRGEIPSFQFEYPCHAPDRQRWFLLTAAPLRHASGGAIVSHLDITDRKEHEEELRQHAQELAGLAEQLRRSNQELDQFAYITSHDLRAPLRGIANLASWIEEDLDPSALTPQTRRMLELLRGRVARMEGLIDGILEYSRIGRTRRKIEEVDVRRLLSETIDLIAPPAGVTVEIAPGMPAVLETDRLQLQQVFMNLIGNAIKHAGRADPTVTISVCETGGRMVEFAVADNGQGIDPQYHERIFVMFQTLAPRDKVEGAGVGLSLVKKIVESHGGSIGVESQLGRGARFKFTWPKQMAPTTPTPPPPAATTTPKRGE